MGLPRGTCEIGVIPWGRQEMIRSGKVKTQDLTPHPPSSVSLPTDAVDKAHVLDAYYVAARHPNGHAEGAPFEHYGKLQSKKAIGYAGEIINFVCAQMA